MTVNVGGSEAKPSNQVEHAKSNNPPPVASPYLEVQMKAKAELTQYSKSLFKEEKIQHERRKKFLDKDLPGLLRKDLEREAQQIEEATLALSESNNQENPTQVELIETEIRQIFDQVISTERKRVTDTTDIQHPHSLEEYVDNEKKLESSVSLIATLNDIPDDTFHKDSLSQDIMRLRILRAYNRIKNSASVETRLLQDDPPINSILTEQIPEKEERKLQRFLSEMKQYGIDGVETYYSAIADMNPIDKGNTNDPHAKQKPKQSCGDVDTIAHNASQKIRNMELPREEKIILEQNIAEAAKRRRNFIVGKSTKTMDQRDMQDRLDKLKMSGGEFTEHLEEALKAYKYFTPDDQKDMILQDLPGIVAHFFVDLRNLINKVAPEYVTSDLITRYGWQFRVGRPEELVAVFKKYESTIKSPDFSRFLDRVKDEYLQTEASGFEVHENLKIKENVSAEALLRESMNSLLKIHRPRGQDKVYFTVFYGEQKMQKIAINTKEDITSEELDENITKALENAKMEQIDLSFQERAELGYKRYSLSRNEDPDYKKIYGHLEEKGDPIEGDYIIQIKGQTNPVAHSMDDSDEYSPATLFAVDDHQAALLLDKRSYLNGISGVKTTLRYRHQKKDGLPAYVHSQKVFSALKNLKSNRYSSLENTIYDHFDSQIESNSPEDDIGAPLLEGRAHFKEINEQYPTLQFSHKDEYGVIKNEKLSPAFTRALIYGLANDIDVFHFLHAANKENDVYFDEHGDRFDSLQPIYTSFNHLKSEFKAWKGEVKGHMTPGEVKEWLKQYSGLKSRAEKGYCDVFTFAATPPGKYETPFADATGLIHGGAQMLNSPTGGMFSGLSPQPLSEDGVESSFVTAQSSTYNTIKINLLKTSPSMGVVGYLQRGDVAISTCRKMPCQAQETFRDEFLKLLPSEEGVEPNKKTANKFLKQFHPLLEKWDGLLKGKNTLTDYTDERKKLYEKLLDEDTLGHDGFMALNCEDSVSFQKYLDGILQKSAEDTFGQNEKGENKILRTKREFMDFMNASGVDVTVKKK